MVQVGDLDKPGVASVLEARRFRRRPEPWNQQETSCEDRLTASRSSLLRPAPGRATSMSASRAARTFVTSSPNLVSSL
jgi:hypothetical protein